MDEMIEYRDTFWENAYNQIMKGEYTPLTTYPTEEQEEELKKKGQYNP